MAVYNVIERLDSGTVVVAVIKDGEVTGTEASMVQELLDEQGWTKDKDPRRILHGDRLFAVLVEESNS